MAFDQPLIDDVKAKNPGREVLHIEVEHDEDTHEAIATVPSKAEWNKYLADSSDADLPKKLEAQERLVLACVKAPTREEMQALFAKRPAIVSDFYTQLAGAVGAYAKSRSKKL